MKYITEQVEFYNLSHKEEFVLEPNVKLCLEINSDDKIRDLIIDGMKNPDSQNLYICLLKLLYEDSLIKNHGHNKPESLKKR